MKTERKVVFSFNYDNTGAIVDISCHEPGSNPIILPIDDYDDDMVLDSIVYRITIVCVNNEAKITIATDTTTLQDERIFKIST